MRPQQTRLEVPNGTTALREGKRVHIRLDLDRKFRAALREAVAQDGGKSARYYVIRALEQGPARGGAIETINHIGSELQTKLALTAQIVDGMEIACNGFKKWLELTGFANDLTMVKGFVAWAEYKAGQGRVITGVKQAFDKN